jgi:hypothetical protein
MGSGGRDIGEAEVREITESDLGASCPPAASPRAGTWVGRD